MIILAFLISFSIYLYTLAPTVYVGDSGELISACYTIGIPHPPGYPIYAFLGKLFTVLIPLGNIGYRVNLMSTVLASVAVMFLYLLIKEVICLMSFTVDTNKNSFVTHYSLLSTKYLLLPIVLVFAFSKTFWLQSVQAEVYTLNALFVVIVLLLVLKGINVSGYQKIKTEYENLRNLEISNPRTLFLLFFIFGLSLCNHHTMILFIPIILVSSKWMVGSRKFDYSLLATCYLLFLLALNIYLYLPLRSLADSPMDWGNPDTLRNISYVLFRKQYHTQSGEERSLLLFTKQVFIYCKLLFHQFNFLVPLISLVGIMALRKIRNILWLMLGIFIIIILPIILISNFSINNNSIETVKVFFIPSYIIVIILFTVGFNHLKTKMKLKAPIAFFILLIILIFTLGYNKKPNDLSKELIAYNNGWNNLITPTSNSALFTTGEDNEIFPIGYLKLVEGRFRNINVYDDGGCVITRIYGDDFKWLPPFYQISALNKIQKTFLEADNTKVYHTLASNIANLIISSPEFKSVPFGVLYIARKRKGHYVKCRNLLWKKYPKITTRSLYEIRQSEFLYRTVISRFYYMKSANEFADGNITNALKSISTVQFIGYDISWVHNSLGLLFERYGYYDKAINEYKMTIKLEPGRAEPHNNLGIIYMKQRKINYAINEFKKTLDINPNIRQAYYNLFIAYRQKGDVKKAMNIWNKIQKMNIGEPR